MRNLLQNELEQIVKRRCIKNYKNMSKEEFLIAFLKSEQSLAGRPKSKSNIAKIVENKKNLMNWKIIFQKKKEKKLGKSFTKEKISTNILKNQKKKKKKKEKKVK